MPAAVLPIVVATVRRQSAGMRQRGRCDEYGRNVGQDSHIDCLLESMMLLLGFADVYLWETPERMK